MVKVVLTISNLQSDTLPTGTNHLGHSTSSWRLTQHGWQDSTKWVTDSFAPVLAFELIHPVVWAMLVILLVTAAMIWASEEWDLARFFREE